ncbi:MAG: hypothetical protein ACI8TX_000706 [Hyphomicrobiaceae bacterium]|jgi:hypothetical protein
MKFVFAAVFATVLLASPAVSASAEWNPEAWGDTKTLEYLTDCPGEGEHWSPVWLVVEQGQLYISLGSKAADRVACSTLAPYTSIKIEGERYDRIELVPETQLAATIEQARWDKYWTNIFAGYFDHDHYLLRAVSEAVSE